MAQPDAGARKENKSKSSSFSRKVTLIKLDDECTSFSEMRNLSDRSVIELSTRMTQDSVKNKILETFPYLEEKRSSFRCAASKKVDNDRKEFDFGGSRIWDGKTIRAKINGNSNLYILEQQSREDRSSSDEDSPVLTSGISESDQESSENVEDTRINPGSGNLEGGYPFYIEFAKELPDNVSSGRVEFSGVANFVAQRIMHSSTLTGIVPSRLLPGTVKVTAWTDAGDFLGETHFTYHAKTPPKEIKELVDNPNQLYPLFSSFSEQFGFSVENECGIGDSYSSLNLQDAGSYVQLKKQQSVKFLELLLYTAAEEDAQRFVEMLFSTSAGPIVFNSYKSRRPLPEDVAQANGNDDLAQYLRDMNTRLSEERPGETESNAINWLELAKAVQQEADVPSFTDAGNLNAVHVERERELQDHGRCHIFAVSSKESSETAVTSGGEEMSRFLASPKEDIKSVLRDDSKVAPMLQTHVFMGSVQQTLQQNVDEPVPLKRKKKDSGTPVGKNVVVLKSCNVTIRNNFVFMPDATEMAQLKKKEMGQFVTNVQISTKMSQKDIRELLISLFPYLGDQRFYCASAVDNRTRLDFHGERRIWDGRLIKQIAKGNSPLYIYIDKESFGKQDFTSSKQPMLKPTHDQMTPTIQSGCRIDKDDVSIMTQGGILVQSGMIQNIVSTASQSQSRKPAMHIADVQSEGSNTIPSKSSLLPHTDVDGIVSSSLKHQLKSLTIASADSEHERCQLWQTAASGHNLAHVSLEATTRQGQGNGAATMVQGIVCNSADQSKRCCVMSAEVQCPGKRGSVSNATDAHQEHAGTSASDFESQSSDSTVERPSDSGIDGSDNLSFNDRSSESSLYSVLSGVLDLTESEMDLSLDVYSPTSSQVASMAQSLVVTGSVQETLQQIVDEPVPLKRKKKDSGTPVGKNVVVLKSCNVTMRNNFVFMPNTIEMARLKKKEKRQFVANVQISSKMSQEDIRELLISLFPYLGDQRFYCASAVYNRTRLDFHGERRIWDGRFIMQKIKGYSCLYIYIDEVASTAQSLVVMGSVQQTVQQNVVEPVPLKRRKKGSGTPFGKNVVVLKRCNVTMRNNFVFMPNTIEMAKLKQKEKGQFVRNVQISSQMSQKDIRELLISLFPYLGDQRFYCASAVDNRTRLDFHGERRIWDGRLIKRIAQGNSPLYIYIDEESVGKQDSTSSKQSMLKLRHDQMTPTMQSGCRIDKDEVQCAGKRGSVSNAADAHQEHAGTSASDFEPQSSDSTVERPSDSRIEGSDYLFVDESIWSSENSLYPVLSGLPDPTEKGKDSSLDVYPPTFSQESLGRQDSTSSKQSMMKPPHDQMTPTMQSGYRIDKDDVSVVTQRGILVQSGMTQNIVSTASQSQSRKPAMHMADGQSEGRNTIPSKSSLLPHTDVDVVKDICPSSSSLKGKIGLYITLTQGLPDEVKGGVARFEGVAAVVVQKLNPFLLRGTVPPSQAAGDVIVTVETEFGKYLGFTVFTYVDEMTEIHQIVNDSVLQSSFFVDARRLSRDNDIMQALDPLDLSDQACTSEEGPRGMDTSCDATRPVWL